ncbi:MAG: DegT/DnrJ/EryC1/StrS family aminotransferase [Paracoccaceae bacterium]|nr:DegT/DnrJ/EryC1/StrS family aminotransferase [Paracoccaceae bacterium]
MTDTDRILYTKPSITDREIAYADDAVRTGWGAKCYDYIHRFEKAFAEHLGVKYAYATSSATGALHLGMAALDIGPGDEVIMADTNWIATAAPVVHLGARPVFVDIRPDSWCLDPEKVEQAITPRTKAIAAVHIYGNLCEMDALNQIARRHGLAIIEDAAEALGSSYRGKRAGSMGSFGAFSFHGTKTFTTGEGGMFVTNDDAIYEKVLHLGNHGRKPGISAEFWADIVGYKFRISNIQAAIGLGQVERADELIARKREIFHHYHENLNGLPGIRMNPVRTDCESGYWLPIVAFDAMAGISREDLREAMREENIDARVVFWPLSSLPPFGSGPGAPNAVEFSAHGICLPSYHDMTTAQQDRVIRVLHELSMATGFRRSRPAKIAVNL